MKIETKLSVGDRAFFLMHGKVHESYITYVETRTSGNNTVITYTIDRNPAGSQYTTKFYDNDIFASKDDLLKSL